MVTCLSTSVHVQKARKRVLMPVENPDIYGDIQDLVSS